MTLLRKVGVMFAVVAATLVMTGGPAAASEGWVYHSSHEGDVFGDMPCLDLGQEMKQRGEIQGYHCIANDETDLWDLYVIRGTWVYHSRYGDVWDCGAVAYTLTQSGQAYTTDCRRAFYAPYWMFDLYYIAT